MKNTHPCGKRMRVYFYLILNLVLVQSHLLAQHGIKLMLNQTPEDGLYSGEVSSQLSKKNKVIIAEFKINYLMDVEFSGPAGKAHSNGKSGKRIIIQNSEDLVLQELTNNLYTYYLDELNKSGIHVLSYQKLLESQTFKESLKSGTDEQIHSIIRAESQDENAIIHAKGKSYTAGKRRSPDFSNTGLLDKVLAELNTENMICLNKVEITVNSLSPAALTGIRGNKNISNELISGIYPVYSESGFYCTKQSPWVIHQTDWWTQQVNELVLASNIEPHAENGLLYHQVKINPGEYRQAAEVQIKAYLKNMVQTIENRMYQP